MKILCTLVCAFLFYSAHSQLLSWSPDFITEQSQNATITADATKGNQALKNQAASDVYVHIGVITNYSADNKDWKHVQSTWATTADSVHALSTGTNQWTFTLPGTVRSFFKMTDAGEKILKIAILFRSGDASAVLRNSDGSDMFVPVYTTDLQTRITQPFRQATFTPISEVQTYKAGDAVTVSAIANTAAALQLFYNGSSIASSNGTTISATPVAVNGNNQIVVTATSGSVTKADTLSFYVNSPVVVQDLPAGVRDGINYGSDGTSATLVLFAPNKTRAAVIGDFNSWTRSGNYELFRTTDGSRYWITLTGLQAGVEYAYQYVVDDTLKVADMFAEKILDPVNDPSIDPQTYPNLKAYPAGQTGIVSVLQTSKPAYNWQATNFTKPDKRNLVIYELLVRDFTAAHNWQAVKDSLHYLKSLGINAIEVMPFNEFEGNISWGYNPDFYFVPDKYYGTETALKQFIDTCHQLGIAVIMDMVMNHAFGSSPTVQLYWDPIKQQPAANNPWHNPVAPHPYSVGYDFNHTAPATQELVERVVEHWLTNYKIDGFRWDLAKGFTQKYSGSDVNLWSQYDTGRVTIWKRIYDTMQNIVPGSYCILEHFAANNEEIDLSNYGMLLWGNENYNYNQATMGYLDNNGSDLSNGIYSNRGWTNPTLVTYMESHDEERLMYKNEQYGNSSGSYNIKNIPTGLQRNAMAAAFWAMQPAPKLLWQFGELGYDFSINTCANLTVDNSCRTDLKPIRWDYLLDANRAALRNVYARLFALRNYPAYLPAFTAPANQITASLDGAFKWESITSAPLNIVVIGNFDVLKDSSNITFSHTGTWYDYLAGTSFNVVSTTQKYVLQPGEYYVFIDQNASSVLPLQMLSFTGFKKANAINLNWTTTNEINVSSFRVERSFDAIHFTEIGSVAAANKVQHSYLFVDKEAAAINASGKIYYKIKTINRDGSTSFSNIIKIDPAATSANAVLYPNPVRNGIAYLRFANNNLSGKLQVAIADASGRICVRQTVQATGNGTQLPINVAALSNGVYHVKITDANSEVLMQKLIIER